MLDPTLIDRSSKFGRTRAKSQHISDSLLIARGDAQSEFIRAFDNPQSHKSHHVAIQTFVVRRNTMPIH
jgi:hypothetical protein